MKKIVPISFVDRNGLRCVEDAGELEGIINECRAKCRPLKDLDLSGVELSNLDFSGLVIDNLIFNYFISESTGKKPIFNVNFKGCKISNCSFSNCEFVRCNFDTDKKTRRELCKEEGSGEEDGQQLEIAGVPDAVKTEIQRTDFFFGEFKYCRFRNASMELVDFRYCQFYDCSLGGVKVKLGDFYMTAFKGTTNFYESKFSRCSLTFTTFEHEVIRIASIDKLAQECYKDYSNTIIGCREWRKQNPCGDFSHLNESEDRRNAKLSKISCREEAGRVYAQFSAIYAGNGLNHDSNEAYVRAKTNVACASLHNISIAKNVLPSIWNLIAYVFYFVFGFGYRMSFVICDFVILITAGGFMWFHKELALSSGTKVSWFDAFTNSLINSFGPYEGFYSVVGAFLAGLHTALGILLVGFLGYILANRIRNNY